jgi:uncharacterized membrane protein YvbJ
MIICLNCNTQLENDLTFCTFCGIKINDEVSRNHSIQSILDQHEQTKPTRKSNKLFSKIILIIIILLIINSLTDCNVLSQSRDIPNTKIATSLN